MNVSKVYAILTKGRGDYNQWVESFHLEHSQDCATFNSLLNADGKKQVRHIIFPLHVHF